MTVAGTVEDLLATLASRGVEFWYEGGRLRFRAPPGVLSAEQRTRLGAHREEVLGLLRARAEATTLHAALSFSQRALWFVHQEHPSSPAYNVAFASRITSRLDRAALGSALQALIDRHAILRTTYEVVDGVPMQRVAGVGRLLVESHDATGLGESDLNARVQADYERPFDLERGPVVRASLYRRAPDDHVFLLTVHHIAADGWSLFLLFEELMALYAEAAGGAASSLEAATVTYAEYAAREAGMLAGPEGQRLENYWLRKLAAPRAQIEVASDRPRPPLKSVRGATLEFRVDADLTQRLRQVARDEGATLFAVLLAAFKVLLFRYAGTEDVVVGTPTSGRGKPDLTRIVGHFVNVVPLRSEVRAADSFRDLLGRVRRTLLEALDAQEYPLALMVERLHLPRDPSRSPLFDAVFALHRFDQFAGLGDLLIGNSSAAVDVGGLRLQPYLVTQQEGQFDISLQLYDTSAALYGVLKYSTELFDPSTAAAMVARFEVLLQAIAGDPGAEVGALPLLTDEERDRLRQQSKGPERPAYLDGFFSRMFEACVERDADRPAVVLGGRSLSYGELNRRANRVAHRLRAMGVAADTVVGLCTTRSMEQVAGMLGILKAGGAFLPLDPSHPPARIAMMLEDSGAALVLTDPEAAQALIGSTSRAHSVEELWAGGAPEDNPDCALAPSQLAYVIYTSGSTGRPKGVMLEQRGLGNLAHYSAEAWSLGPDARVLQFATASFDASVLEYVQALAHGAALVLATKEQVRSSVDLVALMRQERISHVLLPPALLRATPVEALPHLTNLTAGGEACTREVVEKWSPGRRFNNAYGPTEVTVTATMAQCCAGDALAPSIGRPLPNVTTYIVDPRGRLVPVGVPGELWVGGAGVARGYINRPELTAAAFLPDPFQPGGRVYRTGDLARWRADGTVEFLGRLDHQVKLRGYRIELGEIEAAIATHPGVKECAVIVREDAPGNQRLVAYVMTSDGGPIGQDAVRAGLRARLPEYMIPAVFMTLPTLPRLPGGKIDRTALPVPDASGGSRTYEPLSTEMERRIGGIWSELLGVDRIGRHDNFFELGGHSLLVVTLLERMRRLGLGADVRTVFANPTLSELAGAVVADGAVTQAFVAPANLIPAGCVRIEPGMLPLIGLTQDEIDRIVATVPGGAANVQDIYPLVPLQEGMLYHHLLLREGEDDPYVVHSVLAFDDRSLLDRVLIALQGVMDRHDALRTAIVWEGLSRPVQVVYRHAQLSIHEAPAGSAPDSGAHPFAIAQTAQADLKLSRAPLIAAYVAQDGAGGEWRLALSFHHIAVDHVSLDILSAEIRLFLLGQADLRGAPPAFRDFVAQAASVTSAEHEEYFRAMLGDVDEPTLPFGLGDVRGDAGSIEEASVTLAPELAGRIRSTALQHGVSAAALFHVAWAMVVARCAGRDDVVFGTVLSGRSQGVAGIDRVMGIFINTLPFRLSLGGTSALDAVREAYQRLIQLLHHEQASLAVAQRCSKVQDTTPLFSAILNYRHSEEVSSGSARWLDGVRVVRSQERSNYPLMAAVDDFGTAFTVSAQCAAGVDPARVVQYFGAATDALVGALQGNAGAPALALETLPAAERRLLLEDWNATAVEIDRTRTVHELFEASARRAPDARAVTAGEASLTYGELDGRANRLARLLRRRGVEPGALVAVCLDRSLDMMVSILAVLKAGAAYVPVDPSHPTERLRYTLRDAGVACAITQSGHVALLADAGTPLVVLDHLAAELSAQSTDALEVTAGPGDLAYVIYTSGSTGRPKGVQVEHRQVVNFLEAMRRVPGLTDRDTLLAITTLSFDIAGLELWLPLTVGGHVVIASRDDAQDPRRLAQVLDAHDVTVLQATPATWRALLETHWTGKADLKALVGGEALPRDLATELLARVGELWNMYGPTETTIWSTVSRVEEGGGAVPIGRPIANTRVYVLDPSGRLAPIGVPGELCIGGEGVARGYRNRPELTADKFVTIDLPGGRFERVYRTGDVARVRTDGQLEYLGRRDHQVKIRGFRIELGEIEATMERHPGLRQAVAVAHTYGPGDTRLVGYMVADPGTDLGFDELRRSLRSELPEYMVPAQFVRLEAFPLTPNGKVDRKALPAPEADRQTEGRFVAPRNDTERRLAAIWAESLRVRDVGVHDPFFALGGNSLRAMDVVFRIRKSFGVQLPLVVFLQEPTIAAVAALLAEDGVMRSEPEDPTSRQEAGREMQGLLEPHPDERYEPFPLTDVQEAYWVGRGSGFDLGNVATHVYLETEIAGLDLGRYERTWQRLIDRHDMLRAIVRPDGQQQILERTPPFRIKTQDLTGQPAEVAEDAIAAVRRDMSHQVFPADQWPLFEIRASALADDRVRIHFSFDMLIGDAWSFTVLQRDFEQLYRDPEAALAPLGISFRDYVLALARFRESADYQRSLAYWDGRSRTLPPRPELPLAKDPGAIVHPRFERRRNSLEPELWDALQKKAEAFGLTQNGLLLAAYADVLASWSRRPRFTINLTLFNRLPLHPQVQDLVGDFTSITLLEVELLPQETFLELARKLLKRLWEDLDHRYVSGVQVLRRLAREQQDRASGVAPVILTSTLGFGQPRMDDGSLASRTELVFAITQTPQVWLDHMVSAEDGKLVFNWDAVEELFPPAMLDDMFQAYVRHLTRLAQDDSAWLEPRSQRARGLLPECQARQLESVNATAEPVSDELLHVLFEKQAQLTPDQTAIVGQDARLTYAEVLRLSRSLGRRLRALGAKPNALVAIVMEKGWEQAVAALGILQAGAAYVPIDASLPHERLVALLKDSEACLALTQPGLDTTIEWPADVRRLCVERAALEGDAGDPLEPAQGPEDLAYVIYTSGSTGLPKGVMIDHRGAVNTVLDMNRRFNVGSTDRVLALSSLSFDLSVYDIFGMLAAGAAIVIPEASATRDPARWAELMQRERVTIWNSVPALMEMFIEFRSGRSEALPPSLRLILLSGDWIPVTLPGQIKALSEGVQLTSLGGATEASIWSILYPIDRVDPDWKSVPYGRPMVNQTFHVLDDALEPCPVWVPGQLYIGGIGLAKGYWHDEEKTNAKFVLHPRSGERLYATGDLGRYLPGGDIEFLGREDFQVKIRGFRIELGEIEAAFRQHPAVRSVVVTAVGRTTAERRLVAYVVPEREEGADLRGDDDAHVAAATQLGLEETLQAFLAEKLPEHMCPSRIVLLGRLPLTSNGKVDYRSLPEPEAAPAAPDVAHAVARNATEAALVAVWQEVLSVAEVGIHDTFFDLGGDSVKAIQVVSRANRRGYQLTPVMIFRYPTVAGLAGQLAASSGRAEDRDEIAL